MNYKKILVFDISGREFAIDIKDVDRILSNSNITIVPEEEYFIEGIIDYSETVINVISLSRLFKIDEDLNEEVNIIIISSGEKKVALKMNKVSRIIDLNEEDKNPIPVLAFNEGSFLKGVVKFQEELILLLDIERIINLD